MSLKPKYSKEFVQDLIHAKQLVAEGFEVLQKLVSEIINENADHQLNNQKELYSSSNEVPYGSPVGVTARIRYKDSGDEADKYFSFEKLDEETKLTPSGISAKDIFLCCTPNEFMAGFPTEFFELV